MFRSYVMAFCDPQCPLFFKKVASRYRHSLVLSDERFVCC